MHGHIHDFIFVNALHGTPLFNWNAFQKHSPNVTTFLTCLDITSFNGSQTVIDFPT